MTLIDTDINVEFEVNVCNCCCFKNLKKKVKMDLPHENAYHKDFGPGFTGLFPGACGLGNECVSKSYCVLNRGCSTCNARIHEGECMRIHKEKQLKLEKEKWINSNPDLVKDHYKHLLTENIITTEEYREKMRKLYFN